MACKSLMAPKGRRIRFRAGILRYAQNVLKAFNLIHGAGKAKNARDRQACGNGPVASRRAQTHELRQTHLVTRPFCLQVVEEQQIILFIEMHAGSDPVRVVHEVIPSRIDAFRGRLSTRCPRFGSGNCPRWLCSRVCTRRVCPRCSCLFRRRVPPAAAPLARGCCRFCSGTPTIVTAAGLSNSL